MLIFRYFIKFSLNLPSQKHKRHTSVLYDNCAVYIALYVIRNIPRFFYMRMYIPSAHKHELSVCVCSYARIITIIHAWAKCV